MINYLTKFQTKNKQFVLSYGKNLLWRFEKIIAENSLVDNTTFFNPDSFAWTDYLEANWQTIRQELDEILRLGEQLPNFQDISEDQKKITQDNRWKTYFLYAYGVKITENCAQCPETTRLLETVPGMTTAFFSILSPHKHIGEHRGPYKGVLRYHLGLKIPQEQTACRIRVGDDWRYWEEGKSLIFDDSFPHEVRNDTDETRVILFMDFVRPVKFPWSMLNHLLIRLVARSPFVQDAIANHKKWLKGLKKPL